MQIEKIKQALEVIDSLIGAYRGNRKEHEYCREAMRTIQILVEENMTLNKEIEELKSDKNVKEVSVDRASVSNTERTKIMKTGAN